jgi:signal transduction histidine kinase
MFIFATPGPFIYNYLRHKAEDAIFSERRYYRETINFLAADISRKNNFSDIFNCVVEKINEIFQPEFIALYTINDLGLVYTLNLFPETQSANLPREILAADNLIHRLEQTKKPLIISELPQDNLLLKHSLAVPCFIKKSLHSLIIIGPRQDKRFYHDNDIALFTYFVPQLSLSIEKCILEDEKIAMAKAEQLRRQDTMDRFSASLAHEIDNPIAAIIGVGQVIRLALLEDLKDCLPIEKINYFRSRLDRLISDTRRISKIIKAIREFSSANPGEFAIVDITMMVEDFSYIVEPQFKYEGILFEKIIAPDLYVLGNKTQLEEVLVNLSSNAIHAVTKNNSGDRKICLRIYKTDRENIRIELSDNGYGIKKELINDIFLDFVTTKASTEGMGMGLAIARKIVDNHKGKIWGESSGENQGAVFFVELPAVPGIQKS